MSRSEQRSPGNRTRSAAVVVCLAGAVAVGTLWEEPPGDDAGSLPTDPQDPFPPNTDLDSIDGSLGFDAPAIMGPGTDPLSGAEWNGEQPESPPLLLAIDSEDMYRIVIDRPDAFQVVADPAGGTPGLDVALYLFDRFGRGVVANDNVAVGPSGGAFINSDANDGSGAMVDVPGTYYLAVSVSGRFPVALATGGFPAPIFGPNPIPDGEISGPDGPAGLNPIIGWQGSGNGVEGEYKLIMRGVRAPLARCPADFTTTNTNPGDPEYGFPDGMVNGADLSFFVERWIQGIRQADITTSNTNPGDVLFGVPDQEVDGADLSFFVELWLFGCPDQNPNG